MSQGDKLDFAFGPESVLSQTDMLCYIAEFLAKLYRAKPAEGVLFTKLCRKARSVRLSGQVTCVLSRPEQAKHLVSKFKQH